MTWVKLSDDFAERAAQAGLSDAAVRTHIEALLWTMRRETGGWIRAADIKRFAEAKDPAAAVRELVGVGWWDYPAADGRYPGADPDYDPGGDASLFVIVASMDDQPEPDVIEARRRKTAERVRKHRRRMAGLDPGDPPGNAVTNAVSERVTRDGTGRDYVPTSRPNGEDQSQDQKAPDAAKQSRAAGGGTTGDRRRGQTYPSPFANPANGNGPGSHGADDQHLAAVVHLQSPAADRNARDDIAELQAEQEAELEHVQTWTWERLVLPPHGTRRQRETVTVQRHPTGWISNLGHDAAKACNSIFDYARAGNRDKYHAFHAANPVIWKCEVKLRRSTATQYFCDAHLPDEFKVTEAAT